MNPTRPKPACLSLRVLACSLGLLGLVASGCGSDDLCAAAGTICTYLGSGAAGFNGDGHPPAKTEIYLPQDLTFGPDKAPYIIDWNNHRIRTLAADGTVRTVAGTGLLGDGPEGPATRADFNHPTDIAFDPLGRMVIAAWHNSRIKRVDLKTGMLEDICGRGTRAYSGDDGPAQVAELDLPASVAFDATGNLFIMDQANQVIRQVDLAGNISRFAGNCRVGTCEPGQEPRPCPGTNKFTCEPEDDPNACTKPCLGGFAGDGGPASQIMLSQPFGQAADPAGRLAFDAEGNLYFADTRNHRIRKIDTSGRVTTVAGNGRAGYSGDGGPGIQAQLNNPTDLAITPEGRIFIADTFNSCIRELEPGGVIRTAAGLCGQRGFSGDKGLAAQALLDRPYGVALDHEGNLYIADTYNHRFRVVRR
jgi:DNA-binding beta-propeller fold protein YncE